MPQRLLPIEHRQQEAESGCLAACAQMALTAIGVTISQTELNRLLDLGTGGVPYPRLHRLERYKVKVLLKEGDEAAIHRAIDKKTPPILFVRTYQLTTYWELDTRHALVVVGYDESHFYLNDPAFADAPKRVPIDEVMLAWLEFDYMYATVER